MTCSASLSYFAYIGFLPKLHENVFVITIKIRKPEIKWEAVVSSDDIPLKYWVKKMEIMWINLYYLCKKLGSIYLVKTVGAILNNNIFLPDLRYY